jgi:hypothetical protein
MAYTVPGQQLHVLQQQPQLLGPQQFMGLHQAQPTFMQVAGNLVVPVQLRPQILQPIPLQHPQLQQQLAPVQHNTPQHIMQAAPGALPPVSPAHPGWAPQQQQQPVVAAGSAGPMLRRSPGSPAVPPQLDVMRGPPPPAAGRSSAGQQALRKSSSPMPTSGQLTSDALSQLLSNLAGTGVLAKGGGGAAEDASKVQKVKDFQPAFLKVLWAGGEAAAAGFRAVGLRHSSTVQCQRGSRAWGWLVGAAASPACCACIASLTLLCCVLSCKACATCILLQAWHADLHHACMACPFEPMLACLHVLQLTLCVGWVGLVGGVVSVNSRPAHKQQSMLTTQSRQRSGSSWMWRYMKAGEQAQVAVGAALLLVGGCGMAEPFVEILHFVSATLLVSFRPIVAACVLFTSSWAMWQAARVQQCVLDCRTHAAL